MELAILSAIIVLTLSAAISYKSRLISFILSLASIVFVSAVSANIYTMLILAVALLNLFSLLSIRNNQIAGVDYSMLAIMAVATAYVFFVKDLAILLTLFVVVSVPTYLLVMVSDKKVNVDVGIKYVTFMVIATVLFLIGAALLYFSYPTPTNILYPIGLLLLITGLGIEVGIAPVHEWVPDVFSTADPIPVSIIASLAKFVPFIVAYKILLMTYTPSATVILLVVGIIAAVSMFIGNIGALTAKETSRVLAYSTVANMGYILATFAALSNPKYIYFAIAGGLLQLAVNSFGKIGFFTSIKDGSTSPITAYLLTFSFIGLPPLMGFWSKLFILYSLVYSDFLWLAVVLVINSAISVPYYLRLARELGVGWKYSVANVVATFAAFAMLVTVIPPDWFVETIKFMEV